MAATPWSLMNRKERRQRSKMRRRKGPAAGDRTIDEAALLQEAAACLQGGLPDAALALCRRLLEADPGNADALNFAGIAAFQTGEGEAAASYLEEALSVRPDFVDGHNNLGNVL